MAHNVIAIICDCDGTLCPDTTNSLVSSLGLELNEFWMEVSHLVENGWDPPLAYLNRLLELGRQGRVGPITRDKLHTIGSGVQFYPGALDYVDQLRAKLQENVEFRDAGIVIDLYIVSSGIEEILKATPLTCLANDVFACAFDYDPEGKATAVKRAVSFTEKTKFIFAINKGISGEVLRKNPYLVNDTVYPDERRVPFDHMVYIGDGPSDIPCFSMIKQLGGHAIGVMPPEDKELRRPYELARGQRLTVGPYTADYRDGSDLFKMVWRIVESTAISILEERAQKIRPAPSH